MQTGHLHLTHLNLTWVTSYLSHLTDYALNIWEKASGSTNSNRHPAWNTWNPGSRSCLQQISSEIKGLIVASGPSPPFSSQVSLKFSVMISFLYIFSDPPKPGLYYKITSFWTILSFSQLKFSEDKLWVRGYLDKQGTQTAILEVRERKVTKKR